METIEDIRHRHLLILLAEYDGSVTKLSKQLDKSYAQVWQWVKRSKLSKTGLPRSINSKSARHIEQRCNKEPGWMDRQDTQDQHQQQQQQQKTTTNMLTNNEISAMSVNELIKAIADRNEEIERAKRRLSELLSTETGMTFSSGEGGEKWKYQS